MNSFAISESSAILYVCPETTRAVVPSSILLVQADVSPEISPDTISEEVHLSINP